MAWSPDNNAQLATALRTWAGGIYSSYEQAKRINLKYSVNVELAQGSLADVDGVMTAAEMADVITLVRALVNLVEQGTPIDATVGPIIGRALRNVGV